MDLQKKIDFLLKMFVDLANQTKDMADELGIDQSMYTSEYWVWLADGWLSDPITQGENDLIDAVLAILDNPPDTVKVSGVRPDSNPGRLFVAISRSGTDMRFVLDDPDYNWAVETERKRFNDLVN